MNKNYEKKIDVSIIIPCYNSEKYIGEALKSLEEQEFKNFEVILINDGSEDLTEKIIKEYLKKSNLKLKYIFQKNKGVSSARNLGLKKSEGEYILFLDADDIYHREYIKKLYLAITKRKVDTSYCCYSRNIKDLNKKPIRKKMCRVKKLSHMELMNYFMLRKGPSGFWSFMYKKSIIDKEKINFNENIKYGEDTQFTWKYLSNCKDAVFLNEKLYGYRENENSVMNSIKWESVDVINSVKEVEEYLNNNNDEFKYQFKEYMIYRTIWSVLKDFAKHDEFDLYKKAINQYNADLAMKKMTIKSKDIRVRISSFIYCINTNLFYKFIKQIY